MNGGQTPRCLRRADSGMPGELTPRSDSSNSPPLDVVCSVGLNSNTSSETSSSGVHSNASNASHSSSQRRATSVDDLTGEGNSREESPNQWRSCSLQRGTQPPNANSNFAMPMSNARNNYPNNNQPPYPMVTNNHNGLLYNGNNETTGCPAVLMQNSNEATVVIHRRLSRAKLTETPQNMNEEPFGRPTNMRLTSFTESNDLRAIQASSATLPHYPTQPVVTYPHCSTMPLPHATHAIGNGGSAAGSSGSCGNVLSQRLPANNVVPHPIQSAVPSHTTLPSHHNGVRLAPANPFVKRFPPAANTQSWQLPGHHTFPQLPSQKILMPGQIRQSDRDSANFSMASSGDSDTCLPH